MSWQWQNEYLWQSCSATAKASADGTDIPALYKNLAVLTAKQPLTNIADNAAHLAQICDEAAALRAVSERLVVVGTGGSTLGANTLCAMASDPTRVRFLENCDPISLEAFLRLERETTSWCIISKSGETLETLASSLSLIDHYRGLEKQLAQRVRVVTANAHSSLGKLAVSQGWKILDHPPTLGGRFSLFSIVGLLPAAYAGMDISAIARAAHQTMRQLLDTRDVTLAAHAGWLAANMAEKPMQLLMAYADRLRPATQWYKQLWAESLGKDGKGGTPVTAIGAIDQHSQLQLYLDGPRDKLLTLWLPNVAAEGKPMPNVDIPGLAYLAGKRMGEVMQATAEATVATLAKAGVPLRVARGALTATTLAEFLSRQMLETLAVSLLMNVDPYSQPAVEDGKKRARATLAGSESA
jgi:glucose-6-phosphate isomerase